GAAYVVLAGLVKPGHLRSLTADQGATILGAGFRESFDNSSEDAWFEFAGAEVIQKEQGFGAHNGYVVDTVIHQVLANRIVAAGGERNFELGPDSIDAGNQNRLAIFAAVQCKKPTETADIAQNSL